MKREEIRANAIKRVTNVAKIYRTLKDFRKKEPSAYILALRYGVLKSFDWLEVAKFHSKNGTWCKANVYSIASRYKTRHDFMVGCPKAYATATNNKWLDEFTWLASKDKKWTHDSCELESRKYSLMGRGAFQKGSSVAYQVSRKNGWLDEFVWLTKKNNVIESKIYSVYRYSFVDLNAVYVGLTKDIDKRDEQHRNPNGLTESTVFKFALSHGIDVPKMDVIKFGISAVEAQRIENETINEMRSSGIVVLNKARTGIGIGSLGGISIRTKESVFDSAKKFSCRGEFYHKDRANYEYSLRHGWLDKMNWFKPDRSA